MKILVKYYRLDRSHLGNSRRENQCITVRQRTARYSSVHSSALFMSPFFSSIFPSCHHFHVALFSCYTIFFVALWSSCIFSMLHFFNVVIFRVALFSGSNFSVLHFSHLTYVSFFAFLRVALFSCCTLFRFALGCTHLHFFVLYSFLVVIFPCCTFHIALFLRCTFLCCRLFVLYFSVLHFFRFALFLSSTFFVLHFSVLHLFMLNSFHLALLHVLHFFHVAFFLVLLHVALTSCCTFSVLYSFHVALFPCCILSIFDLFS